MTNNKIKVNFKLEDIPMIIETLEKIQNENEDYKQTLLDIKEYIESNLINHCNNFFLNDIKDKVDKALGDKENE